MAGFIMLGFLFLLCLVTIFVFSMAASYQKELAKQAKKNEESFPEADTKK